MSVSANAPVRRVLVANRGEIALRVFRTCREMGIGTVAVYGAGEEGAGHARYADDAFRLPESAGLPYLDIEALLEVAARSGADAIHPGYGFLAEHAPFANAVREAGLRFIGPSASVIAAMGDKVAARRIATEAGVPPVPGTSEPVPDVDAASAWARVHGYPVAIKASGGGGGRGFRVARDEPGMAEAFAGSSGEAERYFANPAVYLERYLDRPRHIEVQVLGDEHGQVVAFAERECSIQRRHQKLVEESPSMAVDADLRDALRRATVRLAETVGYVGAGTIEYLLDADGGFHFLEMNTRIQVEHTVTEMVTGIDLVREQMRIANGERLDLPDEAPEARGWAMECRINAEDPGRGFAPVPGTIARYREPVGFGVRVDGAVIEGDRIRPEYDSMIAKLVTWGRDRAECLARMRRALGDFTIEGTPSTIPFHRRLLDHPRFIAGDLSTTFLSDYPEVLDGLVADGRSGGPEETVAARALVVEVNGRRFETVVHGLPDPRRNGSAPRRARPAGRRASGSATGAGGNGGGDGDALISPIQGTVLRVAVEPGQHVEAGDLVCVVEAMKMENELTAHRGGTISRLGVSAGEPVAIGAVIATIAGEDDPPTPPG